MGFLLSKLLPQLLYPLGLAVLLQLAALVGHRRRWAPWASGTGLALLWIAASPWLSRQLVWGLEEQASRLTPASLPRADAVMVLGGGLRPALPPRRRVEVAEAGDRLLTGVTLMREGKAPWLLVSGGVVSFTRTDPAPAEAMSAARLAAELGVPPQRILLSETARNTAEEAAALARISRQRGWRSVLLITSATHLPRSLATFRRRTDLTIVPVASDYLLPERSALGSPTPASVALSLLPSADALALTTLVLREHLGSVFYRLRGWS
ncbi:MAG: YdcF family protein [Cyanobium sp.]